MNPATLSAAMELEADAAFAAGDVEDAFLLLKIALKLREAK